MVPFIRGIRDQKFIEALNNLYHDKNSFWYKMVSDQDLFIAIRNDYLNVYFNGQSICKLEYLNGSIKGQTHQKYLGVENDRYFSSINGIITDQNAVIKNLGDLDAIKINVKKHIGKEKFASYKEVLSEGIQVIDVEVTFVEQKVTNPKKHSDYGRSSIDYLALKDDRLIFYEAKHFSNFEIRSRNEPKVFDQILRYEKELIKHQSKVLSTYKLVLSNLKDLKISLNQKNTENLQIDFLPKLIVFEVDKNENDDIHLKKLRKHFGSRLILKYTAR